MNDLQKMKKIKFSVKYIFIFIFITPLFLWVLWLFKSSEKVNIFIMNKTSDNKTSESIAFKWFLTNKKYKKTNGQFYSLKNDFLGAHTKDKNKFNLNDISTFSEKELDSIVDFYHLVYYIDTYGVTRNKCAENDSDDYYSMNCYGGLDKNDHLFLKKMKEENKLIITEFNFFAPPTTNENRMRLENLFGLKWTNWLGKYFNSLDTTDNSELPEWIVRLYKKQHNNQWPFKNAGIVFVHTNEILVVLEHTTDLVCESPVVTTAINEREKFNIPDKINYLHWFDIMSTTDSNNHAVSLFEIKTTPRGDSILAFYKIPGVFPAVYENNNELFYYFCGDFSDISSDLYLSRFKFIPEIKKSIYKTNSLKRKESFYWHYYFPFIQKIMNNYLNKIS